MSSVTQVKKKVSVFHEGKWRKGFVSDEAERGGFLVHEITFEGSDDTRWCDLKRDKVIKISGFDIHPGSDEESRAHDESHVVGSSSSVPSDSTDKPVDVSAHCGADDDQSDGGAVEESRRPAKLSPGESSDAMSKPKQKWDENIVISILDPSVYVELDSKGLPWCRYCGARETSGWSRGPWGSKNLCIPHYVAWWQKKTLDLRPYEASRPTQPINPSANTEFKYKAWKRERERKREMQKLESTSKDTSKEEDIDEVEFSRFKAEEESAAARSGRRISSRAIRVKFVKLQEEKRDQEKRKILEQQKQAEAAARREMEKQLEKKRIEEFERQAALRREEAKEKERQKKDRERALLEAAKEKQRKKAAAERAVKKRSRHDAVEKIDKRSKTAQDTPVDTKVAWAESGSSGTNDVGLFSWTAPLPIPSTTRENATAPGSSTQFVWTRPRRG